MCTIPRLLLILFAFASSELSLSARTLGHWRRLAQSCPVKKFREEARIRSVRETRETLRSAWLKGCNLDHMRTDVKARRAFFLGVVVGELHSQPPRWWVNTVLGDIHLQQPTADQGRSTERWVMTGQIRHHKRWDVRLEDGILELHGVKQVVAIRLFADEYLQLKGARETRTPYIMTVVVNERHAYLMLSNIVFEGDGTVRKVAIDSGKILWTAELESSNVGRLSTGPGFHRVDLVVSKSGDVYLFGDTLGGPYIRWIDEVGQMSLIFDARRANRQKNSRNEERFSRKKKIDPNEKVGGQSEARRNEK